MSRGAQVIWTEAATRDLDRIVSHVAADSALNAERALDKLERAAANLATAAGRGRVVPELQRIEVTTYRELVVTQWRIVYRPGRSRVHVMAVLDSRRDLELVLLARLLQAP